MQKKGYYRVEPIQPNFFSDAPLSEIVRQLESCSYRCEAGPLENNLAFRELRRRSEELTQTERDQFVRVARIADTVLKFIYEFDGVPDGQVLSALDDALEPVKCLISR